MSNGRPGDPRPVRHILGGRLAVRHRRQGAGHLPATPACAAARLPAAGGYGSTPDDTSLERIEELVDAAHWRAALAEALAQLTTAERDAVRLRVIDQLDYATVAARLRCSEQAARARVHRGLARLATTLEAT
jgi:RNA polymerase sigma-70 factor (ECF subfamily)